MAILVDKIPDDVAKKEKLSWELIFTSNKLLFSLGILSVFNEDDQGFQCDAFFFQTTIPGF